MSEHNEMGDATPHITDNDEGTKKKLLSDMRRAMNLNDEGRKKELLSDMRRTANLVSVLSIAAAFGGFGYVAYGGDKGEVGLRSSRLGTIGVMSAVWFFSHMGVTKEKSD